MGFLFTYAWSETGTSRYVHFNYGQLQPWGGLLLQALGLKYSTR
jgi:hypothetical protein